jgi:hypothetical protein
LRSDPVDRWQHSPKLQNEILAAHQLRSSNLTLARTRKMPTPKTKRSRKHLNDRARISQSREPPHVGVDRFLWNNRRNILILLCLYAGIRVLVFAAAFPLFNNVDEEAHFASIRMYARGQWPGRELPSTDPELAAFYVRFRTQEYMGQEPPWTPIYRLPLRDTDVRASWLYSYWLGARNVEAQSPPLYYLLGAAWYRIGAELGMAEWELAYWVRFLSSAAYSLMIWVSHLFVRRAYPRRIFLCLGVPALLAVFPQDVYFGLNRDVFSAPMSAIALLLMLMAVEEKEPKSSWLMITSGAFVGLTFIDSVANCVLYFALALSLWAWGRRSSMRLLRKVWIATGCVFSSLVLPGIWMLRNRVVMGDFTGSRAKIEYLGWTVKPSWQIFSHPLFSFGGSYYFLRNLWETFWCGECVWHLERMHWSFAVRLYLLSSVVTLVAVAVQFFRHWKENSISQRLIQIQCFLVIFGSVVFMASISLLFDFHRCYYPSAEHPFFVSGRIISGALVPFALLYLLGMEFLLAPIRKWISPAVVLAFLMLFITITEFQLRRVVFASANNFFALRTWQQQMTVTPYQEGR